MLPEQHRVDFSVSQPRDNNKRVNSPKSGWSLASWSLASFYRHSEEYSECETSYRDRGKPDIQRMPPATLFPCHRGQASKISGLNSSSHQDSAFRSPLSLQSCCHSLASGGQCLVPITASPSHGDVEEEEAITWVLGRAFTQSQYPWALGHFVVFNFLLGLILIALLQRTEQKRTWPVCLLLSLLDS